MAKRMGSATDRVPPHSEEAERGVLGSILIDSERVIDLCIERQILPESFYFGRHRDLYETLCGMHRKNLPADMVTVTQSLKDEGKLESSGGVGFLDELVDFVPISAHAEHYIDIVHQKHLFREIINQARESVEKCYAQDMDAQSLLAETEESIFELGNLQRKSAETWPDLLKKTVRDINLIYDNKKGTVGLPSGFKDLDRKLRGLQPADMVVLAARPSMGKTSLALNIAENIALAKDNPNCKRPEDAPAVALFSLEMSADSLVRRMLCGVAGVPFYRLAGGDRLSNEFHTDLLNAADKLKSMKIFIDDAAGLDVVDLRARARRLARKHEIAVVIVDYLQLLQCREFSRDGRQRETMAISSGIKSMAKELGVPVIVLSQLSRGPETRDRQAVPRLSDLRDSGAIEQDADVVLLLRRPCKYKEDPEADDETLAIVDVAKHRNGPTGEVRMNFIDQYTRFHDRIEEHHDDEYAMG